MARRLLIAMAIVLAAGCAETVRCPDGQVFGDDGRCVPIPDGGADASDDAGSG